MALLRLDGDLYESTMDALTALYDKVCPGGIVIIDDWGVLPPCRKAVQDFFAGRDQPLPEMHTQDWSGVWFRKP
ncbi:Macrocin-O-methyltransferase [Candidatus Rhodobacter oscarellae]|uniref:Macrocin-O-methyltransferase n=1 Tax=Candidatus Rhodobacter oscarellae TaxID=1675527 RepID=A0A0J9E793_9RHOB|nr:Macrocin-O-methyltransferase [Candidatus Rhodobacter lobularis]